MNLVVVQSESMMHKFKKKYSMLLDYQKKTYKINLNFGFKIILL